MAFGSDDLTPFLVPPPDNTGLRYGQAKLTAWNPITFENAVHWRGTTLHNLPVLAGPAALSFAPGHTVALIGWAPGGGAGSWAILGQWMTPGSDAAEQAIEFMRTSLGRALAAEVFAAQVHTDTVAANESTTSSSYTDLTTPGPQVTADVSDARVAIVTLTALIGAPITGDTAGGTMSFEVSGASSIAAAAARALELQRFEVDGGFALNGRTSADVVLTAADGLNAGTNTFTAKYQGPGGSGSGSFGLRVLKVIAL